ncbi:hypothetical protein GCM10025865_03270 [Paraoerskovia sediminicola]|uniref:HTH tetR-type domain-containing protein n=1 Tax=Paraoerskovia sediminicola TaxID=1138587 RepID=A0ABN6XA22_9CELL|nr:hypothetical protein GCM10025865_03270 [Paraoerskovia sediminicola]
MAERRSRILDCSRDLFASSGFHHISMDDIAAAVGVTKPVLYRHFRSKLDLYLAVLEVETAALTRAVVDALDTVPRPAPGTGDAAVLAVLDALCIAYVSYATAAGPAGRLVFESDVLRDPRVRDLVHAPDRAATTAAVAILSCGTAPGTHPRPDLTATARTCVAFARAAVADAAPSPAERSPWAQSVARALVVR